MSGLQRLIVLNVGEEAWHEHNRRQVHELEHEDGCGQDDDVPSVQKFKIHDWVGLDDASQDGCPKQKESRDEHADDSAGVQPV